MLCDNNTMSLYTLLPEIIGIVVMFAIIGKMAYRKHKAKQVAKAAEQAESLR